MSDITDVLNEHSDWAFDVRNGDVLCIGCDWSKSVRIIDPAAVAFRSHQADMLAPLVEAAKSDALREAADAMQEERATWCLDDAGRYWIKRTLDELRERGAAADPEGRALVQAIHERKAQESPPRQVNQKYIENRTKSF